METIVFDYDIKQITDQSYELQCIDCNCNNCYNFQRDVKKTRNLNNNPQIVNNKIHYGFCAEKGIEVGEIANICLPHNQECFIHRKDPKYSLSLL